MYQRLFVALCTLGFVGGCAQPQWAMEPPQKPSVAPEMAKLSRFLGSWTGTAEFVSPSPEEMKAEMPEGEEMPSSFAGGGVYEWALGGMFLKGEGWHEMGEDQRANYVEYWTWYPKVKKYRTWYFDDWGGSGEGWAWFDADDPNTMRFKGATIDGEGRKGRGHGMMTFIDDNSYKWTWSESGPMGKMELKGTSKRKR